MKYIVPPVSDCTYVFKNFPAFLVIQKSGPHVHSTPALDHILNQMIFFHKLSNFFYEIHFNIIFPTILCCLMCSFSFISFYGTVPIISNFPHACYLSRLSNSLSNHEILRLVAGCVYFYLSATGLYPEPE